MLTKDHNEPWVITPCRGLSHGDCPHVLPVDALFLADIQRAIIDSKWTEFFRTVHPGPIKRHHLFTVALAGCANGCSRPHIADIGLIRSQTPRVSLDLCTQCGLCAQACPDQAISMTDHGPTIDSTLCLNCMQCGKACPSGAITPAQDGFRLLLGGKLGRHPMLAREWPEMVSFQAVPEVLINALCFFQRKYEHGKRFGDILARHPGFNPISLLAPAE